jgi:RsiW-degrading membrane proteinase PrsW (M82 family)
MLDLALTLIFALLGGFLPAYIWLRFWLREDKKHPEPNNLIIKTFFFGVLMVPVAFVIQNIFNYLILDNNGDVIITSGGVTAILLILFWATVEEWVKYIAAKKGGLDNKANDEPVDMPIYMITAALGFAAIENALFIVSPLLEGNLADALLTGNMRFVGATLVHISSSALIGIFGGLSYFYKKEIKRMYIFSGFILAVLLHSIFNLFIINGNNIAYLGFIIVWVFTVLVAILFEKIKKIKAEKI